MSSFTIPKDVNVTAVAPVSYRSIPALCFGAGIATHAAAVRLVNRGFGGDPRDVRSRLFDGRPRKELIKLVDDLFSVHGAELPVALLELEQLERDKIGPFSIQWPLKDRTPSILAYFGKHRPGYNKFAREKAYQYVRRKYFLPYIGRLHPLTPQNARNAIPKKSNWGLPYLEQGKTSSDKYLQIALEDIGRGKVTVYPATLGWRGQQGGPETTKQRVVWGFAHSVVIHEARYGAPLIEVFKKQECFCALQGRDEAAKVITVILKEASTNGQEVFGYDVKGFDLSVSREIGSYFFRLLCELYPRTESERIKQLEDIFFTCDLLTPGGYRFTGRTGSVPSGSYFTNRVDSFVQLRVFYYVLITNGLDPDQSKVLVRGDDGVWYCPGLNIDRVEKGSLACGFSANKQKQYVARDKTRFCQKLYLLDYVDRFGFCVGIRSIYRTFGGMLSHEYFKHKWSKAEDSVRWIRQLENAKGHPLFHDFIKLVADGDREYRLGARYPGGPRNLFRSLGGIAGVVENLGLKGFLYTQSFTINSPVSSLAAVQAIEKLLRLG